MHVLDDQQDGAAFAERAQKREQSLEDPRLDPGGAIEDGGIRGGRAEFGEQSTQIGRLARAQVGDIADPLDLTRSDECGETTQCLDDRREWQPFAAADRNTTALEDER